MKTETFCLLSTLAFSVTVLPAVAFAGSRTVPTRRAIPWNAIGKAARRQVRGDALAVSATDDGALLHCAFQKMVGHATTGGLWLTSTTTDSRGERFRLVAVALGRSSGQNTITLCPTGTVEVTGSRVRWERPGLTEEYSVSMDGVQQDFVVGRRPPGHGELRLDLSLSGARAEQAVYGAKLVLAASHRTLAYSRLQAVDATGRQLAANIEVVSASRLVVEVHDAGAVYPIRIDPTFSDANWVSLGSYPGADGVVATMLTDTNTGTLYIGGAFRVVGTAVAAGIAKWSGNTWLPVGSGLGGEVRALALDSSGDLYAGGAFTNAALAITNIAKWNGTGWSALGPGFNGAVLALAMDGSGNLYAGGSFTNYAVNATNIARWNGSSWSALGSGMNNIIRALAVDGSGNLYAGGLFTTANGIPASYVAEWNGSSWSALGLGMNGPVYALAAAPSGNVYASGNFSTAGGNPAGKIAVWNGGSWSPLGSGLNTAVLGLALDGAGNLYAGGFFTSAGGGPANRIAVWNGSTWSALGSGINTYLSYVYSIGFDGSGNVYAGGSFAMAGDLPARDLAKWNGSTWSTFGSGINSTDIYATLVYAVTVDARDNLYVGGTFSGIGNMPANNIAEWNGSAWLALGTGIGPAGSTVEVLTTDDAGNLYAGGSFTNAGGVLANNIAEWNGSTWLALGSGVGGSIYSDVYGMATDGAGNLYAGGGFTTAGGVTVNGIAKWNGSAWSALGTGVTSSQYGSYPYVQGMSFDHAGNLYVGGTFNVAGAAGATNVAEWNGSSWSALGSGLGGISDFVTTLAADASNHLYAGGSFTNAGGILTSYIAEWNGVAWTTVGSGMNNWVGSLAIDPAGNLYAGGPFTIAGGVPVNYIARWDGTAWSALGSGVNFVVASLAADNAGRLYAGGYFTAAGTNVSAYVAQANVLDLISNPHRNPNGSLTFNLLTTPNTTNRILATTNLAMPANWQPIYTNVAPANGAWQFTDSNTYLYPDRFYRSTTP